MKRQEGCRDRPLPAVYQALAARYLHIDVLGWLTNHGHYPISRAFLTRRPSVQARPIP
jgi:hypothetical protein